MEVDSLFPISLQDYINQYKGNSRFVRLLTLADKNQDMRTEAIRVLLELAKKEKKL
jgi:hypothetical protein